MSKYKVEFMALAENTPITFALYPDEGTAELVDDEQGNTLALFTQPEFDPFSLNDLKLNLMNMDSIYMVKMGSGGVTVSYYSSPFESIDALVDYIKEVSGLEITD